MKTIDKINIGISKLPEKSRKEVLNLINFLLKQSEKSERNSIENKWNTFSIGQAMQGIEDDDQSEYSESDLKEKF